MNNVEIIRFATGIDGTYGLLKTTSGFECYTGELPWRNNATGISCIPVGKYKVNYRWSPAHQKKCYHVDGVIGRTDIEIHSANFMGDTLKGRKSELKGCIALGKTMSVFETEHGDQKGISSSKEAIKEFEEDLLDQDFDLDIQEKYLKVNTEKVGDKNGTGA